MFIMTVNAGTVERSHPLSTVYVGTNLPTIHQVLYCTPFTSLHSDKSPYRKRLLDIGLLILSPLTAIEIDQQNRINTKSHFEKVRN